MAYPRGPLRGPTKQRAPAMQIPQAALSTWELGPTAVSVGGLIMIVRVVVGKVECGHLFWPRLVRLSSSDLAPPSWVAVAGDGVSSSDLAPPLGE
jgi:hypothetical protein